MTISKIASSRFSGGVCAASSLPIRRCASARDCFRDQRIGGFLHAVVDEPVGAFQALDQLLTNGLPESRVDLLLRCPENDRQRRDLGDVAEAGELLQRLLRFGGQAAQLPDHQVHHIVGVALGVNAIEVPGPAPVVMIEGEQALFGERGKKLNGEERIASRLLVHQLRQRRGALRLAAKRIRNQLPEVFTGERRKHDLLHVRSRVADRFELAHQRMGGSRPRCPGRRRSAAGAAHPTGSTDPRADRASPRRAIAGRRGTAPADAPAGRTRR